jgi:hypothetical protein
MLAGTEEGGDVMTAVTLAIVSGDDPGTRALLKGTTSPPPLGGTTSYSGANGVCCQGWAGTSLFRPRQQRSRARMMEEW